MKDPVVLSADMQTYERAAILRWMKDHKRLPCDRRQPGWPQQVSIERKTGPCMRTGVSYVPTAYMAKPKR